MKPIRLTDEERLDWLRLIRSQNVGPRTFRTLLNHFGDAHAALEALPALARRGGGSVVPKICSREAAEREISCRKLGVALTAIGEADYPYPLQMIDDPPPLLAIRGHAEIFAKPRVAIVGSRNSSAAGVKIAQQLARDLGHAGFAVASGLARGIDAAAHRASIATGTVAVLAGRQDRIYPSDHLDLLDDVLTTGVAVTEMPLGWEPRAQDFPRRNRLISGVSLGVVVVEAAKRSGSLITARLALEPGREVFAVPGSPLDPRAEGTNGLIKQGATPVTESADNVSVLQPVIGVAVGEPDRDAGETSRDTDPGSDEGACCRPVKSDPGRDRRSDPPLANAAAGRAHGAVGVGNCRTARAPWRRTSIPHLRLLVGELID